VVLYLQLLQIEDHRCELRRQWVV